MQEQDDGSLHDNLDKNCEGGMALLLLQKEIIWFAMWQE